jgi:hypothetical protein
VDKISKLSTRKYILPVHTQVMTRRYEYYQSNYDFFRLALEILLGIRLHNVALVYAVHYFFLSRSRLRANF